MIKSVSPPGRSRSTTQLLRFFVVGLSSNAAGYLLYLLGTHLGLEPKLVMTLLYVVGASIGFVGNRVYTFGHSSQFFATGVRYVIVHGFGYLLNLTIQVVVVDLMGYPHQLAQALGIFLVALFLFVAFKHVVFVDRRSKNEGWA